MAVAGALVVVETMNSGIAPASARSPPMIRPGPSSRGSRVASVSASVGATRAARRPAARTASRAVAMAQPITAAAGSQSVWRAKFGGAMPWRTSARASVRPSRIPGQIPATEPIRAMMPASQAIMRRI